MSGKGIIYILAVAIGAFAVIGGIIFLTGGTSDQPVAAGHVPARPAGGDAVANQPVGGVVPSAETAARGIDGPYITTGLEAETSNFFVPGRVESLDAIRDPNRPTVVWVSAVWCEICRQMRPFVFQVANQFAEALALAEIDLDDNPHIKREYGLFGSPTFLVLDSSGEEAFRFNGATRQMFEQQLARAAQLN